MAYMVAEIAADKVANMVAWMMANKVADMVAELEVHPEDEVANTVICMGDTAWATKGAKDKQPRRAASWKCQKGPFIVPPSLADILCEPPSPNVGQKYIHFHWKLFISNIFVMWHNWKGKWTTLQRKILEV